MRGKLTSHATESTHTLDVRRRQVASRAGNSTLALAVLEGADASSGASRARASRGGSLTGCCVTSCRSSRGSGSGGSGSGAAGEGRACTSAVDGDSHRLEHGLGLGSRRIDGKGHALATVALLTAVEPCVVKLVSERISSPLHPGRKDRKEKREKKAGGGEGFQMASTHKGECQP